MRQSIAILSILASAACAQDVVSFFFPGGYDGIDPVATINTANPSTTEFHIACPTGADDEECGWGPGLDVTILSQTRFQAQMSTDTISMSLGCDYNEKAVEMTCTVNQLGGNDDTGGKPITATLSSDDVQFLSATVVAGNSLLTPAGSAVPSMTGSAQSGSTIATSIRSASAGAMTPSGSIMPTSTMASSASASTPAASGSGSASASLPESTGAAHKYGIEGSALLALAGAAALNFW
ncbi:hypothetical protein BKA58DRAFT_239686 [Alternaria rosae]|uniref:uncharacterized protein n=1 Tax=Alternaria rosae TaxID=1187941 RepID=UPI001E8EB8C6|nr:uncharacterized protein BKA58DRAFT_239686 [Alternaria rosae]KAH6865141.1 hypothetical protein BKA58DRAFT_239686 [Alternaria rosae]